MSQVSSIMLTFRAITKSIIFFLKYFSTWPSRFLDYVTGTPIKQHIAFKTTFGSGEADMYLPSKGRKFPGLLVCLGVVPIGFDHPQIEKLGSALAQAGFATLFFQSTRMQEYVLHPEDIGNVAAAYQYLTQQPFVEKNKCGFFGTCVGGSFALLAAAHPTIRDNVKFIATFAPYASMHNLVPAVASSTYIYDHQSEYWQVDPLTKKVFVHSVTDILEESEAAKLRSLFDNGSSNPELTGLSSDGEAIFALLQASDYEEAATAYNQLPVALLKRMEAVSPISYLQDIRAGLISICHDRYDLVVPVGESRLLVNALHKHPGLHYTEFMLFEHVDPTKRSLKLHRLLREAGKFFGYLYPIFKEALR